MDDSERNRVRELLGQGLSSEDVARRLGVPKMRVAAVRAHITIRSYGGGVATDGTLSPADVEEIDDAADLKFGLERDLQDALRRNIAQLDPSLKIVDGGIERVVEARRIDILAEDEQGSLVVIELESAEAPESAIAQVSSYVGSLQNVESGRPVRAILNARSFPTRVRLAARAAGIALMTYGYSFTFPSIEGAS